MLLLINSPRWAAQERRAGSLTDCPSHSFCQWPPDGRLMLATVAASLLFTAFCLILQTKLTRKQQIPRRRRRRRNAVHVRSSSSLPQGSAERCVCGYVRTPCGCLRGCLMEGLHRIGRGSGGSSPPSRDPPGAPIGAGTPTATRTCGRAKQTPDKDVVRRELSAYVVRVQRSQGVLGAHGGACDGARDGDGTLMRDCGADVWQRGESAALRRGYVHRRQRSEDLTSTTQRSEGHSCQHDLGRCALVEELGGVGAIDAGPGHQHLEESSLWIAALASGKQGERHDLRQKKGHLQNCGKMRDDSAKASRRRAGRGATEEAAAQKMEEEGLYVVRGADRATMFSNDGYESAPEDLLCRSVVRSDEGVGGVDWHATYQQDCGSFPSVQEVTPVRIAHSRLVHGPRKMECTMPGKLAQHPGAGTVDNVAGAPTRSHGDG